MRTITGVGDLIIKISISVRQYITCKMGVKVTPK